MPPSLSTRKVSEVVGAHEVGVVDDVAQFAASAAVEAGVRDVEFGAKVGAALGNQAKG